MAETNQITIDEALELVDFYQSHSGKWYVSAVKGHCGTVKGYCGIVEGNCHRVGGKVLTTINGREWQYIETPKGKLKRLIEEDADKEQLLEAVNQMEEN